MISCIANESTSSANTSCAMLLTKSVSDDLQVNTLNLTDSSSKQILRHMSNRIRPWKRNGNHVASANESTSSASISSENRVTISHSDALKSNGLYTVDSTPKLFSRKPSKVNRRRQEAGFKPVHEIRGTKPLINRKRKRQQITVSTANESTSSANTSRSKRLTMSAANESTSTANTYRSKRLTMSVSDDFKSETLCIDDSTPKIFQPSNKRKRRWQEMVTSTPKDEVSGKPDMERDENEGARMQEITVSISNESTSSANASRTKRVNVSKAFLCRSHLKRNVRESNSERYIHRKHIRQETTTSIVNGSTSSANISRTKRVIKSASNASKEKVFTRPKHVKRNARDSNSKRYFHRKRISQEIPTSIHERSDPSDATTIHDKELSTPSTFDVPKYDSDEDLEPKKRIPKSKKTWIESRVFSNEYEAKTFIKQESTWSIYTTNILSNGKKVIYRCTNAKLRGKQCDASVCLFYLSKKEEVILYKTAEQHSCQPNQPKKMSKEKKAIIEKLFMDGYKTRKAIQCKLAAANIELPTNNQLNNFISELNMKFFGRSKISIGELETFLQRHSTVPEDPNAAFIVDYLCDDKNDGDFKFFVSTKTLLRNAVGVDIVSADTTYKMVWQGFPISPIGTTDMDRHFHLFGTLVSKDEKSADFSFAFNCVKNAVRDLFHHEMRPKILIADAAEAIHNGARSAFGLEIVILMCWFHSKKAVKKNISRFVKDVRVQAQILSDMSQLNLSRSKVMFEKASAMFLAKYSKFKEFCLYFKTEWLENNPNWYEGAYLQAPGVKYAPSTNNACESWNRNIKDEKSERNRYPLNVFINKMLQWTVEWSEEYKSGAKKFVTVPTIDLPLWTLAYKWVKMNKPIKRNVDKNGLISYKFAADEIQTFKDWNILTKWNTFEEFKERFCLGWQTYIQDEGNWINGSCSCPSFMKTYICKHIVGLAIRLKFVKPPLEAKALPLNQKRKRGRPSKAKKALLVQ